MTAARQSRLLLVDDAFTIRTALGIALREHGYDCTAVASSVDVCQVAEIFRPDLAILDVWIDGVPAGYEIARRLRVDGPLPIIFLSAADSVRDRLAGFKAGADDYLSKPFAIDELLARIAAVLRRSGLVSMQLGDLTIDEGGLRVVRAGQELDLTRTEYGLLVALAREPGSVLSKQRLLSLVWGQGEHDDNVVEVHMSALRRKLEAHGPRLVHTRRAMGYVLRPIPSITPQHTGERAAGHPAV